MGFRLYCNSIMNLQRLTKKDLISHIENLTDELSEIKSDNVQQESTTHVDEITQLGQILDTSLNEILIFDTQTFKFVFVNESARTNLGYTEQEFYEMTPLDINPSLHRNLPSSLSYPFCPEKNQD